MLFQLRFIQIWDSALKMLLSILCMLTFFPTKKNYLTRFRYTSHKYFRQISLKITSLLFQTPVKEYYLRTRFYRQTGIRFKSVYFIIHTYQCMTGLSSCTTEKIHINRTTLVFKFSSYNVWKPLQMIIHEYARRWDY